METAFENKHPEVTDAAVIEKIDRATFDSNGNDQFYSGPVLGR